MADRTKISKFIRKLLDAGMPTEAKKAKSLIDAGVDEADARKLLSPEAQNVTETALVPVGETKSVLYGTEKGISGAKAPDTPVELTEKIRPGIVGKPPKQVAPVLNKEIVSGQKAEKPERAWRPMSEARKKQYQQRFEASRGKEQLGPRELTAEDFEADPTGTYLSSASFEAEPVKQVQFPGLAPRGGQTTEGVAVGATPLRQQDRTDWAAAEEANRPNKLVPYRERLPATQTELAESEYIPPVKADNSLSSRVEKERLKTTPTDNVPAIREDTPADIPQGGGYGKYLAGSAAALGTAAAAYEALRDGQSDQPEGTGQTLAAKAKPSAQVPVGGESAKPSTKEASKEKAPSQGPSSTTGAMGDIASAVKKEQGKKADTSFSRQSIDDITKSLDNVAADVEADPRFAQSPARTDLAQLRAEAYRAYKEKADRNEWMDLAERALNAIGQFASARLATPGQVGGLPLSRTDYGSRTAQAFREYEAQLGQASEQERAGERELERFQTAKEKEIARRRETIGERLKTRRLEMQEAGDIRRAEIAAGGRAAAAESRKIAQEVKTTDQKLRQDVSDVDKDIGGLERRLLAAQKYMSAPNREAKDKAQAGYEAATRQSIEAMKERADEEGGYFWQDKPSSSTLLEQNIADQVETLRQQLQAAKNKKEQLRQQQAANFDRLLGGKEEEPAAPTAPTTETAGQPAPEQGIVIREVGGERYRFDTRTRQNLGKVK